MDLDSPEATARCEHAMKVFDDLYLQAIPKVIQDGTAFISFHPMFAALEGLAGYRFPTAPKEEGEKFKGFIQEYFPAEYHGLREELWDLRCGMQHASCPRRFDLTHRNPDWHLRRNGTGPLVVNADSLFGALRDAALKFFGEVRARPDRRADFVRRLDDPKGGAVAYIPLQGLHPGPTTRHGNLGPFPGGSSSVTGSVTGQW
jgi:hypothetical protein